MKNEDVSDEVLISDYYTTEKELKAYKMIRDGFNDLAQIPENRESGAYRKYQVEFMYYNDAAERCEEFFNKLKSLMDERELL